MMIGVRLDGRLGNHMFQYAFALALSRKLWTPFYMDQYNMDFQLYQYFKLPSNKKKINEFIERYLWQKVKYSESIDFDGTNWKLKCKDRFAVYKGYMQSELFFNNVKHKIHKEFVIKDIWVKQFNDKYSDLFKQNKVIVIHLRKGDYTNYGEDYGNPRDLSVPDEFIYSCLSTIENRQSYRLVFISDDIEYCKNHFSQLGNAQFETNLEIIDMQLLINADICIISNSSFSWWGAYLNKKPNTKIFYPKYWMGYNQKEWYPHNFICKKLSWTEVHHKEFIDV